MNSTAPSTDNVSVNQNMSELKESALTVLLDTTMILTQINASANLDTNKSEDSVNLSAHLTKPTSMENANATTDFLSITENVFHPDFVLLTVTLIRTVDAVSATMDIQLSMDSAVHINIVVLMVILNTVNAIVMLDSSGFSEAANHAELMKPTMELSANVWSAMFVMSMASALNLTLSPTAMIMKDTIQQFKLAFVSLELNISEENASLSPLVHPTLTTMG